MRQSKKYKHRNSSCKNDSNQSSSERENSLNDEREEDIEIDLSKKEKMYATPEGLLDVGQGRGVYQNKGLNKFYEAKKEAYEEYLKSEKIIKSEYKAKELREKMEKTHKREQNR